MLSARAALREGTWVFLSAYLSEVISRVLSAATRDFLPNASLVLFSHLLRSGRLSDTLDCQYLLQQRVLAVVGTCLSNKRTY